MCKPWSVGLFLFVLTLFTSTMFLEGTETTIKPTVNETIKKADSIRRFGEAFTTKVTITTIRAERVITVNQYEVFSIESAAKMLAKFTAPKREVGKALLMVGRDLWIYLPDVGKPIRIPPSQRLVGDVVYGDLMRINYADDYLPTLLGTEPLDGTECYLLDLVAKDDTAPYGRIKYWVSKEDFRPLKAEYFTALGRLIKTGFFEEYRLINGTFRPTRITLIDAMQPQNRSILEYDHVELKPLPEKLFDKNYLKKLD